MSRFIENLNQCLRDSQLALRFVFIIRHDFIKELAAINDIGFPLLLDNAFLQDFTWEQARRAIAEPARFFGVEMEEALVETILMELNPERILPAHLSIVCHWLYTNMADKGHFSIQAFQRLERNVPSLLREHLNDALDSLPSDEGAACRKLLKLMVTWQGTKDLLTAGEIVRRIDLPISRVQELLKILIHNCRLIREVQASPTQFELSHESLVGEIQSWLDEEETRTREIQNMLSQEIALARYDAAHLIPLDRLAFIEKRRDMLDLSPAMVALIVASFSQKNPELPDYWLERLMNLEPVFVAEAILLRPIFSNHTYLTESLARPSVIQMLKPFSTDELSENARKALATEIRKETATVLLTLSPFLKGIENPELFGGILETIMELDRQEAYSLLGRLETEFIRELIHCARKSIKEQWPLPKLPHFLFRLWYAMDDLGQEDAATQITHLILIEIEGNPHFQQFTIQITVEEICFGRPNLLVQTIIREHWSDQFLLNVVETILKMDSSTEARKPLNWFFEHAWEKLFNSTVAGLLGEKKIEPLCRFMYWLWLFLEKQGHRTVADDAIQKVLNTVEMQEDVKSAFMDLTMKETLEHQDNRMLRTLLETIRPTDFLLQAIGTDPAANMEKHLSRLLRWQTDGIFSVLLKMMDAWRAKDVKLLFRAISFPELEERYFHEIKVSFPSVQPSPRVLEFGYQIIQTLTGKPPHRAMYSLREAFAEFLVTLGKTAMKDSGGPQWFEKYSSYQNNILEFCWCFSTSFGFKEDERLEPLWQFCLLMSHNPIGQSKKITAMLEEIISNIRDISFFHLLIEKENHQIRSAILGELLTRKATLPHFKCDRKTLSMIKEIFNSKIPGDTNLRAAILLVAHDVKFDFFAHPNLFSVYMDENLFKNAWGKLIDSFQEVLERSVLSKSPQEINRFVKNNSDCQFPILAILLQKGLHLITPLLLKNSLTQMRSLSVKIRTVWLKRMKSMISAAVFNRLGEILLQKKKPTRKQLQNLVETLPELIDEK